MVQDKSAPMDTGESQRCQSKGQEKHMKETLKMGKSAPTDESHFVGESVPTAASQVGAQEGVTLGVVKNSLWVGRQSSRDGWKSSERCLKTCRTSGK